MAAEADIFAEIFPDNVSVSDLCDCGRHKRHHGRRPHGPKSSGPFPCSDYQATYKAVAHPRPRSTKKPPPETRDPNPPPMMFSTNQRSDFISRGQVPRAKPIKHGDSYEPSTQPMEGTTSYTKEFVPKELPVDTKTLVKRDAGVLVSGKFDPHTTNKEHFRQWVAQPSLQFGELPSFTGSLMFPEKGPLPESTMRNSYQGTYVPPVEMIKNDQATIKLEGQMHFTTTHKDTFNKKEGGRQQRMSYSSKVPLPRRAKFQSMTQSMTDFGGFQGAQPPPPRPVEPAPVTIDLKFDNSRNFATENRSIFRGHDVMTHPAPAPCKKVESELPRPSGKFDGLTSNKRDFQPIDISSHVVARATVPMQSLKATSAHFDGRTTTKEFFQDWGTKPRVRYGDFHENRPYIPPQEKFSGESISRSVFTPKKPDPVVSYKPVEKPISTDHGEYNTEYGTTYVQKFNKPCRAQIFLLQQALKKQKQEQDAAQAGMPPIAAK